ncbi:20259_t:CDS:2, partial [Racocetra persica]
AAGDQLARLIQNIFKELHVGENQPEQEIVEKSFNYFHPSCEIVAGNLEEEFVKRTKGYQFTKSLYNYDTFDSGIEFQFAKLIDKTQEELTTTASSKFLADFQPSQNAFVIELLTKEEKKLVGKAILDEFACGGTGLHAATGPIFNPRNLSYIVGGSSSGDSIRRPAAYCGIVGFKPSYGLISRSGIIPMASSLDTVGILARKVQDIKPVFSIISQPDLHDLLTVAKRKKILSRPRNKIAVVAGIEKYLSSELNNLYHNTIKKLEKAGYPIEKITIPKNIREHLQITYLILCSSELISHLNSLQGITYGPHEKIAITHKRSKYLGEMVKQRLLIGSYFLENQELFVKAQKMRYLVD